MKLSLGNNWWRAAVPVAIGLLIVLLPRPAEIEPNGWLMLAIFVATVTALITQPLPMGAIAIIGMTIAILARVLTAETALAAFGTPLVWIIVAAFFIAHGFISTGLGKRVALFFVRLLGKRSLGLAYGIAITDLILAPVTPSITARAGGIVFPVLRSLSSLSGSEPDPQSRRKLGAYLSTVAANTNAITAAMFLTAMAGNPLVQKLAKDQGVDISWGKWALAALVPGILSIAIVPALIYRIYPPEIRHTPEAPVEARRQLAEMGPMSRHEWITAGTFVGLIVLWSLGDQLWGINPTTSALAGVCVLLASGVLRWADLLGEKAAWDTMIWLGILVMMAGQLQQLGVISWFAGNVERATGGLPWTAAFAILVIVYFYAHYAFASNTAHIAAMYAGFTAAAIATGTPAPLAALTFAFFSSLFGALTHYASGPAPVLFGAGYNTLGEWWRVGALVSLVTVPIWLLVGAAWMKLLGYY